MHIQYCILLWRRHVEYVQKGMAVQVGRVAEMDRTSAFDVLFAQCLDNYSFINNCPQSCSSNNGKHFLCCCFILLLQRLVQ